MSELNLSELSPDVLLFDPNNFRFQDLDGFSYASEDRFHEDTVQLRAYQRLKRDEGILALKRSILRNGYIPVERLVVRPYYHRAEHDDSQTRWVVIEGNRRLAAIKWILEDYDAGVNVEQPIRDSISSLPVIIVEEAGPDEVFRASLMGIRHVSGINQWGGYQRSKLIVAMKDRLHLDAGEIAERLGLGTQEVNRRYRAFKALEQMQDDEDYGGYVTPAMYPLFHEAISLPVVRTWLGWTESSNQFLDDETRPMFYDLITPTRDDDEHPDREAKITTYAQVRELRNILPKPDAKRALLDPNRSFQEAVNTASREQLSHAWTADVSAAIRSLETMGIQDLKNLTMENIELLAKLRDVVTERIRDHESLTGNGEVRTREEAIS